MRIKDVVYITGTTLRERKTVNKDFYTSISGLDIKKGAILISVVGFGSSKQEAKKNLALNLSKQQVVTGAYKDNRASFNLPKITP